MHVKLALAIALLAYGAAGAQAQAIHRCGNTYSQQPCAGGTVVNAGDLRAPGQKAQTDAATRRDEKAAADMEKARLHAEAQPPAAYIPQRRAESSARAKPSPKLKKPEEFTATAPVKSDESASKKKNPKKKQQA